MANDEKKQDLRSGVHRRLGDWLHMAMIACYMAVLFVQPAAAATMICGRGFQRL